MRNLFQQARFATLSFGCVLLGLFSYWFMTHTGTNRRLGNNMDMAARFAELSPCLIAIVLAIAALRWDRMKALAVIALLASLAGTFLIYVLRG